MKGTSAEVRTMVPRDLPQVHRLHAEVFGEHSLELWRRRYDWQFERSPGTKYRRSVLWVADQSGEILGFLASFPIRVSVAGREVVTLCPSDFMVSTKARGAGLGRRLVDAYSAETGDLAPALQYSPPSGRIFRNAGYQPVDAQPVLLRPYDVGRLLAFALGGRLTKRSPSATLQRSAMPAARLLGGISVRVVNRMRRPSKDPGLTIEATTQAGQDFDNLWSALAGQFPSVLVRDRAFVEWRFLRDPLRSHIVLTARNTDGRLVGYLALTTGNRRGVLFGYLMDLFTARTAINVADSLIAEALTIFERDGVAAVTSLGLHPDLRRRVARFLYVRRKSIGLPALLRWRGEPSVAQVVYDASKWHLSYADGDEAFSF
jgi:ribosomal protein S18 acetylase RimI-like enzyme